ncbi:mitochondrial folate transporter/carrier [Aspergillus udagawae]|uniref:Mitochondrial folate transporter/carrier n=1 Tax=Aspergillus udagawae TaxID=91492 RepID=A0ABQ1BD73_9EURO|nr:mitochondrial folate transporter/carrier [Aspergillus udagawae]GFF60470.1 mitochondrial folate transporter/carrier [Aspergillus udagawae]GFF98990.1 mitochondrial folate transporter/carrier [Aspergillus udagawae]GFG18833.1 mitochondrial folate transporter/carrier [Aspergillus udagawae]
MTIKDGLSSSFVETIAGFTAGIVSTLCLHPLDLLKTRLQVDRSSPSQLGGSLRVIRDIARREGGITAFYRGLTPNIIGNSTSWGLYFLCYGKTKDLMRRLRGSRVPELTSTDYFVASGLAGLATSVLTNPIWVIKTRMLSTGSNTPGAYASFTTGVAQIYRSEGIPGFYRGLLPALFGVSHGALQFMAYEKLKVYRTRMSSTSRTSGDSIGSGATPARQLGNFDFFLTSSLSKIFAGCVTYPYQVLRSRLQTYDAHLVYRGVGDAMAQIWAQEGFAGFYKGLGPNLLRVLPSTWVTFLVYENTKSCLV